MGRRKSEKNVSPVEMLKARVTYTETGFPARLSDVEDCYGSRVSPANEDGWFWIGASGQAAEDIRRRGLHVVGDLTTTYIPADDGREIAQTHSNKWVELMLEETAERDGEKATGGYFWTEGPEEPSRAPSQGGGRMGGPLRKVIVFRLRPVGEVAEGPKRTYRESV